MERIKECITIAEKHFDQTFDIPNVRFDKRGRVAGTANYTKWELNFNMTLLSENVDAFIHRTVAHEIAHLIDHVINNSLATSFDSRGRRKKREPHGANWKRVMAVLGVESSRCHSYDTTNSRQTRRKSATYDYKCTGCNTVMAMGAIRHGKMQKGTAKYSHISCRGSSLVYVG